MKANYEDALTGYETPKHPVSGRLPSKSDRDKFAPLVTPETTETERPPPLSDGEPL